MNPFDLNLIDDEFERLRRAIDEYLCQRLIKAPDRKQYPHDCPRCKAPAYIGFAKVDCSAKCQ